MITILKLQIIKIMLIIAKLKEIMIYLSQTKAKLDLMNIMIKLKTKFIKNSK